jgi:integrase/recombinase XerD
MSNWNVNISGFKSFLQLEKSLSHNSIEAYLRDVSKIRDYAIKELDITNPDQLSLDHLQAFLADLNSIDISERSQARIISGIKAFYKYLLLENLIVINPTELLETPRLGRKLPDTLSIEEIDQISASVDLSQALAHRNKAIIETLYGCGLRVSELINLKLSNCYFEDGFVRVTGKGDKERLVPISKYTIKFLTLYIQGERQEIKIHDDHADYIFLNRRGKQLTRVMIFTIVKNLVKLSGIQKNISPHTFRHSFATHLVDGGADLRAVQEMLGHQSITTTEIYTHLDTNFLKQNIIDYHPRSK